VLISFSNNILYHGISKWTETQIPEALLEDSREAGLEVNTEKTEHVVMSHHRNERKNESLLIANNKYFENVANFKYLGITIIKSKLHSRNN
jgi:hypothetical protein